MAFDQEIATSHFQPLQVPLGVAISCHISYTTPNTTVWTDVFEKFCFIYVQNANNAKVSKNFYKSCITEY